MAMSAFFFPLRAANDQYFADNLVFLVLDAAHAASHKADFICGFSFYRSRTFSFSSTFMILPGDSPAPT